MKSRSVAAAMIASALMALCSGCFLQAEKVPQKTSHITVNNLTRTSHAVSCDQVRWLLTADVSAAPAHVRVVLNLDSDKPKVESVNIDNFQGFTGVADSGAGNATAAFARGTYTIKGQAQGSQPDDPAVSTTAPFKIEVGC